MSGVVLERNPASRPERLDDPRHYAGHAHDLARDRSHEREVVGVQAHVGICERQAVPARLGALTIGHLEESRDRLLLQPFACIPRVNAGDACEL
jgi:hypothetical protein